MFTKDLIHMKKILHVLMLGVLPFAMQAQTVILDHESPGTTNPFTYFGNCALNGTNTGQIANPAPDGVNGSANVGEFVRSNCAETFAGCYGNPAPATPVDLTTDNIIRMKVWMDHVGTVNFKLEGSTTGGVNWLQSKTVTDLNQWVEVEFDASLPGEKGATPPAAGNSYSQVVLFFDLGTPPTGLDVTSYYDDIVTDFVFVAPLIDLPITWDESGVDYTVTDFGGNVSTLVVDPTGGPNMVMSSNKIATAETFAGTTMSTPAGLENPIPITVSDTRMSMRVYSPDAGIPVRLKIEVVGAPANSCETEVLTTVANAWETLVFDFANAVPSTPPLNPTFSYNQASVFFNFGTNGATAGDKTYFWDDVQFIGGGGINLTDLPITFDEVGEDYTLFDFEGNVTTLVADPTNPSNTVASSFKGPGAQFFAGTTMSTLAGFANAIPVTFVNSTMSMRVYSQDAGIPVRLKIEDAGDPSKSVETEAFTTVANTWETLVFDFNNEVVGTAVLNPSYSFTRASVFFNFGTDGDAAGPKTYLWDDVYFGVPSSCNSANVPTGQSHTNLATRVQLNWVPFAGAVACQVQGKRLPTGPTPSVNVTTAPYNTTNVPYAVAGAGTTWTWRVRCACNISPVDASAYTAFGDTFSVPTARIMADMETITLFPNPATDQAILNFNSDSNKDMTIEVSDMLGRIISATPIAASEGINSFTMDVTNLTPGMYFVRADGLRRHI